MTGWGTVGIAVEAMQRGVTDFVEKPWTNSQLLEVLRKQITLGRERRGVARLSVRETQAHKGNASPVPPQKPEIAESPRSHEGVPSTKHPPLPPHTTTRAAAYARARP